MLQHAMQKPKPVKQPALVFFNTLSTAYLLEGCRKLVLIQTEPASSFNNKRSSAEVDICEKL